MQVLTIPVLSDNFCYAIVCDETRQAALIDPADGDVVLSQLDALGISAGAIWNTHHHFDHVGGNEAILARHRVPVCAHANDRHRVPGFSCGLVDGDRVVLGSVEARVVHTPGHTLGGICYRVGGSVFVGDTLFGGGCGRLFEGDAPMLFGALNEHLAANVTPTTAIYFGHEYTEMNLAFAATVEPGNEALQQRIARVRQMRASKLYTTPSSWAEELATNPFLRTGSVEIRRKLADRLPGGDRARDEDVFACLRELRNSF
jgi:hydroxyacylglutathione hydrolase